MEEDLYSPPDEASSDGYGSEEGSERDEQSTQSQNDSQSNEEEVRNLEKETHNYVMIMLIMCATVLS